MTEMRMYRALICMSFIVLYTVKSNAQFFTKTGGNSIPRIGRRADKAVSSMPNLPNLVRRVARTLRFAIEMVEDYDEDGNGELNPEELMGIPFIQNAVRHFLEDKELQGQYLIGESKERVDPKQPYDQRLIM